MKRNRNPVSYKSLLRPFTPEEDALVIEQSKGKIVMARLCKQLKTSSPVICRRAGELGVVPVIYKKVAAIPRPAEQHKQIEKDETPSPYFADHGDYPQRIERDFLLERLQAQYPHRFYESLDLKRKSA